MRERRFAIQNFVDGFPNTDVNQFSIASFNVLNQGYIREGQFKTNPCFLEWNHRIERQRAIFKKLNADVICLQEVQTQDFESNYLEFFRSIGYEGVQQKVKHTICTATFYKTSKFKLAYAESRSRALITGLKMRIPFDADQNCSLQSDSSMNLTDLFSLEEDKYWHMNFQIANVHFQSGSKSGATRMSQLKSLLKQCQLHLESSGGETVDNSLTFLCGDFNDNQHGGVITALQKGQLEAGFQDPSGTVVTEETFEHPFHFTNVYNLAGERHPTHMGYETFDVIDHVFAPCKLVDVVGLFAIRKSELDEMKKSLLPNQHYPSDHLPVGAMFTLKTKVFEKARKKAGAITELLFHCISVHMKGLNLSNLHLLRNGNGLGLIRHFSLTMKAVRLTQPGPLSNLYLDQNVPVPEPAANEVLVKVKACGVCHRDVLDRKGAFPFIKPGIVPGHEIAGVIQKTGSNVQSLKVGDKVASLHWAPCGECVHCLAGKTTYCQERQRSFFGLTSNGGYAQYLVTNPSAFVKVPEGISAIDAASVNCTYGTFWHAAITRGRLAPGESILITGASGGVGSAALQISRALGCRVFAVTSNEEKAKYLQDLGADEIIISDDGKFNKDPRLKNGVDMAFEAVGAPTFQAALRSLKGGGRMVLVGNVTAASVPLSLGYPIINCLEIIGSDSCTAPELKRCFDFLLKTNIRPNISQVLKLEEFAKAQTLLETKAVKGRVILQCDESDW